MANKKKGNKPGIRRIGRTLAFQAIYGMQFAVKGEPVDFETAFEQNPMVREQESETAIAFAHDLVEGVYTNLDQINTIIQDHSQHWKISRIAVVELSILQLAMYEMVHTDIPLKAAINEGIELSKTFGDSKSRGFINGILDSVAKGVADGKYGARKPF
jgi:N utilization substance protein B